MRGVKTHLSPIEPEVTMHREIRQARSDRLRYIQAMLGELRTMAEVERSDLLTYLIEMAYIEASDIVRGQRPLRVGGQKRDSVAG